MEKMKLGNITIYVVQKEIKNLHLSVYPPDGKVKISAPLRMNTDTIRIYAISKLGWIKKQQRKIVNQEREAPRDFVSRESHYFLGKRYLLKVVEVESNPRVELKQSRIVLYVREGADRDKRRQLIESWYRGRLKEVTIKLIYKWEKIMNVSPEEFSIRKMRTKWGTCNIEKKRIWLNLELAKKPEHCIEYIVVHEMTHLLERHHNEKFIGYMNYHLPEWREIKRELNKLPVSHLDWEY
jgi:predicted metal-dependent hydrolase